MLKPLLFAFLIAAISPAEAGTRSFFSPLDNGVRVAACTFDGASCGKPVADSFCKKEGFTEAILFAREVVATTRTVDTGQLCEDGKCQAFARIKCYQPLTQAAN